jgi:hypothetical protein
LYDPSSGAQLHDVSPGNGENIDNPDPIFHLPGLFWLVRLDDNAFQQSQDGRTAVLRVENLLEFDRFQLFGPGNVPTHLTYDTTYTRQPGQPTILTPRPDPTTFNGDPTGIFNWAGEMWEAAARGTFSFRYDDGSFWVTGTMDSAVAAELTQGGAHGHMGHERNGVFAHR